MVQSGNISGSGNAARRSRAHIEDLLDEALNETFPASDPVAIVFEEVELAASRSPDEHAPGNKQDQSSGTDRRH